jgi:hypothetical protein
MDLFSVMDKNCCQATIIAPSAAHYAEADGYRDGQISHAGESVRLLAS